MGVAIPIFSFYLFTIVFIRLNLQLFTKGEGDGGHKILTLFIFTLGGRKAKGVENQDTFIYERYKIYMSKIIQ